MSATLDEDWLCQVTRAERVERGAVVQRLWSGYGSIVRYRLWGAALPSVVVKEILPPPRRESRISHARKLRSYEVEFAFYAQFAGRCRTFMPRFST